MDYRWRCTKSYTAGIDTQLDTNSGEKRPSINNANGSTCVDASTCSKPQRRNHSSPNHNGTIPAVLPTSPKIHMLWTLPLDESQRELQKQRISCAEAINGLSPLTTRPIGLTNFNPRNQGKSSVTAVERWDILLAIVHRNHHQTCEVRGSDKDNAACNKDPVEPIRIGRRNKKSPQM